MPFFWTYTLDDEQAEDPRIGCSASGCNCSKNKQNCCSDKPCACGSSCKGSCKDDSIKNNDGRETCYVCGANTRVAGDGKYNVCTNKKCNWYNR